MKDRISSSRSSWRYWRRDSATPPGSAAAAARLRGLRTERDSAILPGDIIVAVNGHAIDSVARLQSRLDDYNVGEIVRLTVLLHKQRVEAPVRLQASAQ
jgi:S1-C subfamily serine protease